MSRTDLLAAADPARGAQTFHDSGTANVTASVAIPHAALTLLPALHHEAGRDLGLWRLLASSPRFCIALMLEGAVVLGVAHASLGAEFAWAAALLLGIAGLTRNHIEGFARSPRQIASTDSARELRLLLFYLGVAWGLGAFLVLPQTGAIAFVAGPLLTAVLILKCERSALAFGVPLTLVAAATAGWSASAQAAETMAAILMAGVSIAGLSMLQCAIARRRTQDLH
jgi:hypothetical protein